MVTVTPRMNLWNILKRNQKSPKDFFPEVTIGLNCQFIGQKNISIGAGSCIGDNTWLNVCLRDERIRMNIGNTVLVGRQSMISAADYLEIGSYCVLAPRVYISNTDHLFEDINTPILVQGIIEDRKLIVEENCWFGINTVIMGNITIGRGSVIGANSVVIESIPPFSLAIGNPAKIIKMYNPKIKKWEKINDKEHISVIQEIRDHFPLQSREEYLRTLNEKNFKQIDPLVAGGNIHL